MLMKPGATARPFASMIAGAVADLRLPTAAIRSPFIPTSARLGAPARSVVDRSASDYCVKGEVDFASWRCLRERALR